MTSYEHSLSTDNGDKENVDEAELINQEMSIFYQLNRIISVVPRNFKQKTCLTN